MGYERQFEALKYFDSKSWLHEINIPTLTIAGAEDIIAPLSGAKEVQQEIGNDTQIAVVPNGHVSPIEQPQKVVDAILKFLTV